MTQLVFECSCMLSLVAGLSSGVLFWYWVLK